MQPEKDRAWPYIGNTHRKFARVQTYGSWDVLADRFTERQADTHALILITVLCCPIAGGRSNSTTTYSGISWMSMRTAAYKLTSGGETVTQLQLGRLEVISDSLHGSGALMIRQLWLIAVIRELNNRLSWHWFQSVNHTSTLPSSQALSYSLGSSIHLYHVVSAVSQRYGLSLALCSWLRGSTATPVHWCHADLQL